MNWLGMYRTKNSEETSSQKSESGFTIVELMIATVVFSMVLLVCAYAILHVGRMYYKGMVMNRTQDVARRIVDDVADTVKFGTGDYSYRPSDCYKFGDTVYKFNNTLFDGVISTESIVKGYGDCVSFAIGTTQTEFMSKNMRLTDFSVVKSTNGVFSISVTVSYGENDDFEPSSGFKLCKGSLSGGQFCAVSSYSTTVVSRI